MKLKVLGCHGGESVHHRLTSFLIDNKVCIDAGAICRALTLEQQAAIEHVVISHAHLDHVRDLAFLADNLVTIAHRPLTVHCSHKTHQMLMSSLFNSILWPDFTQIELANGQGPVVQFREFSLDDNFEVGHLRFKSYLMNHPVQSLGMVVTDNQGSALAYSSDTGDSRLFWQALKHVENLRAILAECSFSNHLYSLAEISGHLTPHHLQHLITTHALPVHVPIYLYHIKPSCLPELVNEIVDVQVALPMHPMRILELDEEISVV